MLNLKRGDTIGVVAPSAAIDLFGDLFKQGIEIIQNYGYRVKTGSNIDKKYFSSAGTKEERAADINAMFADPEVKAIFCASGGNSANEVLDLINYEQIKHNSKLIMGASDINHLLLAINSQTGLNTIFGPNVKDFPLLSNQDCDALFGFLDNGKINYKSASTVIRSGVAEGRLLGGNLFVNLAMLSSVYYPSITEVILFWEEIDENFLGIRYQLYQLKNSGLLDNVKGMIIGKIASFDKDNHSSLSEMILEITDQHQFPVIQVDYFGHNTSSLPIPIGMKGVIENEKFYLKEYLFN